MYVKNLTLKGFKSFASATSMRLEPGITCIVGPNGSGKSNVVDALAWVMGEQGAKSLRGGKMEDVIFAGTPGRAALGRAEVSLTIDNSDGALPIDYTEVTITRTMFKGGGSDYAINGTSCRLLDIQELLSDSGIGREMHVIVGQGQLDAVLRATPEERRGFIEEAAGVLKHRKRKERALRKLDAMETNLARATDLTAEIRRQLGPLGRQAQTARRAATIQAEVRDARLRLLADDLVQLTSTLEQEVADEQAVLQRQHAVEAQLVTAKGRLEALEAEAAQQAPAVDQAAARWYAANALAERVAATGSLAAERVRLLAEHEASEQQSSGRDPEKLREQAARLREDHERLGGEIDRAAAALEAAVQRRTDLEQAHQEEQQRLQRVARAIADRREGLAKLEGQVAARHSRIDAAQGELDRFDASEADIAQRLADAEREYAELEAGIAADEQGEADLDTVYEAAEAKRVEAAAALEEALEAERTADRDRSSLQARLDALSLGLRRTDGAAHLLAADDADGIAGRLSEQLTIESGSEAAIAAALGWAADAILVADLETAGQAVGRLRREEAGSAGLVISGTPTPTVAAPSHLPDGARPALAAVTAAPEVAGVVDQLLRDVVLVDSVDVAKAVVRQDDSLTAVTLDGDVFARRFVRGGSAGAPSLLEIQAAVDETQTALDEATARAEQARFASTGLRAKVQEHSEAAEAALSRLGESDARMAAIAEQLGRLGQVIRGVTGERARLEQSRTQAQEAVTAHRTELADLEQRLADAQADGDDLAEPSTDERDRLAVEAAAARSAETDQRLNLRTREEQARSLKERVDGLEAAAESELRARERARQARARREAQATVARAVQHGCRQTKGLVDTVLTVAKIQREEAEAARTVRDTALREQRSAVAAIGDQLRELTDTVHRDEVARAEQRLRIEAMQTRAVEELGIEPDVLVEEFGPHQLIAHIPGPDEGADDLPEPIPFERAAQEQRLRSAERRLSQLGRVNPLALEEFAALEERHKFLTEQLEDLKKSKADLLDIVAEVDQRVQQAFADAFVDTAEQFEGVFSRLFPGGEGRLVLTDPDDMLTTGIEVEARPPGKKIKRLSLLSGGERSLVAVALLVSIFKARPSPFYIMDEVEAALDDANLGRLITLFEELRDSSQLIVITHQKRTMEVADALYGVSMRGDGVTTVVSQRIRDVQPA
ncbi:chromosome segregation protein SMC [Branchiibius sp. NY16-3462-2]|uniref:chromosome segregation protein SMC n=1 Tax=Branchiibius sp. NY16-3462-2 TaxID=1807500 RepID=UPI000792BC06|nr:chromosome segregation protein SMC [Branchiibius sp. NY16-3462-2]KYH43294.1 chromosome segregation protein SMC [Branchiibius sp. NY16-3462-2]